MVPAGNALGVLIIRIIRAKRIRPLRISADFETALFEGFKML